MRRSHESRCVAGAFPIPNAPRTSHPSVAPSSLAPPTSPLQPRHVLPCAPDPYPRYSYPDLSHRLDRRPHHLSPAHSDQVRFSAAALECLTQSVAMPMALRCRRELRGHRPSCQARCCRRRSVRAADAELLKRMPPR
eukprot:1194517-Pleurochrysis_carterae.AAC.1